MEENPIPLRQILAPMADTVLYPSNRYIPLLQPKQKWFGSMKNFKVGDLVLMLNENNPGGQWPKALVTDVMPDKAGLVRLSMCKQPLVQSTVETSGTCAC